MLRHSRLHWWRRGHPFLVPPEEDHTPAAASDTVRALLGQLETLCVDTDAAAAYADARIMGLCHALRLLCLSDPAASGAAIEHGLPSTVAAAIRTPPARTRPDQA